MKRALGWTLLLLGIAVTCAGIYLALAPVAATYQAAINDPMADPIINGAASQNNEEDGKVLARKMIRGVLIGAAGLPLTIAGSILLGVSFIQRMRRRAEERARNRP